MGEHFAQPTPVPPILPIPDLPAQPPTPAIPVVEVTGEELLASAVQPNAFNKFFQVTPHFRLFMAGDKDLSTTAGGQQAKSVAGAAVPDPATTTPVADNNLSNNAIVDELGKRPQVTIAETGVTTYNIKDVEIEMFAGPNAETRNVQANRFKLTIAEPMGVGFLDAFKDAAEVLAIHNPLKSIYYLELTFQAYDEQGNIQSHILQSLVPENNARWIWQIQIVNIDCTLDAGGGTYRLDAYPYGEGAWDDDILRSPETFVLAGTTIRDVTDGYMQKLTDYRKLAYIGENVTYKPTVFHAIKGGRLDGIDPGKFKLKPRVVLDQSLRANSMASELAEQLATINQGSSIADFFDFVFANTEEAQQLALDRNGVQDTPNATSKESNAVKFRQVFVIRIEPDIKITGYDSYNEVYIREVTLHIYPYYTQFPITSQQQAEDAEDPSVQSAMLHELLANGFINKRYDYIYTGLNTEVTKFDITFNFAWGALISGDDNSDSDKSQRAALLPPLKADADNEQKDRQRKLQLVADNNAAIAASTTLHNDLLNQLSQAKASKKEAERNQEAVGDTHNSEQIGALNTSITNLTNQITDLNAVTNAKLASRQAALDDLNFAANQQALSQVTPQRQYAEVIFQNKTAKQDHIVPHRVSFKQSHKLKIDVIGTGLPQNYHRDKTIFGTVLGQLYAPLAKQFMTIDLEIRADPFWLGQTNLQRQSFLRRSAAQAAAANGLSVANVVDTVEADGPPDPHAPAQTTPVVLPDWTRGDHIFVMQFRYPLGLGEDLKPLFKQEENFVGLYRVTNIVHHFAGDGPYKQTLKAQRLPLHTLKSALSASVPKQPSRASTPTPPKPTPAAPPRNPAANPSPNNLSDPLHGSLGGLTPPT